jgi:ATP-dependent DNA helicase RecQ
VTDARAALQQHFGFDEFRPGQEQAIEHLLAGHSTAAVFRTGGGKSLCYQLPALLLPGLTLVVSPLIALMKDQIDALHARGIRAARLDSSLSLEEYREVMDGVRSGAMRLLYVAPERFNNERFRQAIDGIPISLFAVDEAHCISEWGHNFRPDYLKLAGYAKLYNAERVLALTATATPKVLDDICAGFDIQPDHAVRTPFHRPNLTLRSTVVSASERDGALLAILGDEPAGPTIVYVTLQKTAEGVARALSNAGHGVGLGHRRGDHRLRHGHRQGRHPPRRALQPAEESGELRAGNRPCRSRRRHVGVSHAGMRRRPDGAGELCLR